MGYTCSILKNLGDQVFFIDSVIEDLNLNQTLRKIESINPDIIIMETTTPSIEYDFDFMKKAKELTNSIIIATGTHVTYFSKESLQQCKAIDIIIKGEYDTRIEKVRKNLDNLKKVKGIAFRKNNQIIDNGHVVFKDNLDELPFPDRETIPYKNYGESWYNYRKFTKYKFYLPIFSSTIYDYISLVIKESIRLSINYIP